jgi:prevent-host-death family protein
MMKSMGAFAAKTHLSELLSRVQHGERIVIQKRGKSVAALVPFSVVNREQTSKKERIMDGLRLVRASAASRSRSANIKTKRLIELDRKW